MNYPDNRGKLRDEDPRIRASKSTEAKRGAAPRDSFRKEEVVEPPIAVVEAVKPPWNAVPNPGDFEI